MNTENIYDLNNNKSIIAFSGADAGTFLQGQTTCDVLSLDEKNNIFGAICNPKGRAIILFHLFKVEDCYYMVLSKDMAESTIKRLKMFVFRSKVVIEDVSSEYHICGLNTPDISNTTPLAHIKFQANRDLGMLVLPQDAFNKLDAAAISTNYIEWQQLLTSECIPDINSSTTELFIPQMLNLDALNGINFQKGCYTGQEIIARMHYKGTVKRRLVSYQTSEALTDGEEVYTAEDTSSIGTVLASCAVNENTHVGLLVLKTSHINESIMLKNGVELSITKPPYKFE